MVHVSHVLPVLHVMLQINKCNTVTQKLIEKGNFEIYFLYITNLEHVFIHVMGRNYVRYTCLCVMCMNVYLPLFSLYYYV